MQKWCNWKEFEIELKKKVTISIFTFLETLFVTAGTEVTVNKLTNEYQDIIIKCIAVQEFEKYDATVVEQHEIRLDVWCSFFIFFEN